MLRFDRIPVAEQRQKHDALHTLQQRHTAWRCRRNTAFRFWLHPTQTQPFMTATDDVRVRQKLSIVRAKAAGQLCAFIPVIKPSERVPPKRTICL
jgi:hypothetical protein